MPEEVNKDVAFLAENVDIKYLKKAIDLELVDSMLSKFGYAKEPDIQVAEEVDDGTILEPSQEKSIVGRIKDLWGGTDRRIKTSEEKLGNLLKLHEKAKEVQKLKQEYKESISKKLGQ